MLQPIEVEALNRAVLDVEARVQIRGRARDRTLLQSCVRAWCDILEWESAVADIAMRIVPEHTAHIARIAIKFESEVRQHSMVARWLAVVELLLGLRADPGDYVNASDEAMSKMELRDYILIALAVAAAGYVVYRVTRRPQPPVQAPPVTTTAAPTRRVLVLVINADRKNIIDALRSGGVAAVEGDQLYQATQALWLGTEDEFGSNLSQWFSEARAVTEPSEYDVHLVRVDLSSDVPGLHRNANQMDRLDAFRSFQRTGVKTTVSPRLPSDAYGTTNVYSR